MFNDIDSMAIYICENIECTECPVMIEAYETRSKYEKEMWHYPCCLNLSRWILKEAEKELGVI